jgi:hypothetical protein
MHIEVATSPTPTANANWIICCQGTTQLITAAAAVHAYALANACTLRREQVVVLIYDLLCPAPQIQEFRKAIVDIARETYGWHRFEFLNLNGTGAAGPGELPDHRRQSFELPSIKPEDVDVVFACRDSNRHDQRIMNYFGSANHICCGDSVGIYTNSRYLEPPLRLRSKIKAVLERMAHPFVIRAENAENAAGQSRGSEYEAGFFSLAVAGGCEPPFRAFSTDIHFMIESYRSLSKRLEKDRAFSRIAELLDPSAVSLLLTSTQSEIGRITEKDEVEAYVSFVCDQVPAGFLLLKPHPRDNRAKLLKLVARLSDNGYRVSILDDYLSVLPVEAILLALQKRFTMKVLATSTAAYGVALICGITPVIGFGPALVERYFAPRFRTTRLEHERLLSAQTKEFLRINYKLAEKA